MSGGVLTQPCETCGGDHFTRDHADAVFVERRRESAGLRPGPCRCEDCRTSLRPGEVPPPAVRDGLCAFCLDDGCDVVAPEGSPS